MTAGGWNPVKAAVIGVWLVLWALGILGGEAARAQVDQGPPPPDPDGAYVWTAWDGEGFVTLNALTLRDEVLKELAAIELALEAERDHDGALARLTEVWTRAAWVTPYEGQWEALVRTAVVRTRLLMATGQLEAAERSANELLLDLGVAELAFDVHAFLLATSDRVETEKEHLQDARLVELRGEIARRMGRGSVVEAAGAASQDPIYEEIRRAAEAGNRKFIDTVGRAAVPALVEITLASREAVIPHLDHDPLFHLARLDERRAAEVVRAHLDGSYLWRRRVLRTMNEVGILRNAGTWDVTGSAARLREPIWLEVVERLAGDPQLALDLMPAVGAVLANIELPSALRDALVDWLRSPDPETATAARRLVFSGQRTPMKRALMEPLLRDAEPRLRQWAASYLANTKEEPSALLELAGDPDPALRRYVADWLRGFQGNVWKRAPDERELAAFRTLAADPDPELRRSVATTLVSIEPEHMPPVEMYARSARDADPSVRRLMVWLAAHPDAAGADALLLELARDADASVAAEVDRMLERNTIAAERYLPLMRARWEHPSAPIWRGATFQQLYPLMRKLCETADGVRQVARWYVEAEAEPWRSGLAAVDSRDRDGRLALAMAISDCDLTGAVLELSPQELADLLCALDRGAAGPGNHYESRVSEDLFEKELSVDPQSVLPALRLVATCDAGLLTKGRALELRVLAGDPEAPASVLAFLRDPRWASTQLGGDLYHAVRGIGRGLPDGVREATLLAAVRDPACADEPTSQMAQELDPNAADGEALVFAVLERWFGQRITPMSHAVSRAIEASARFPERVDPELLIAAARNPANARSAVRAMAALLDPRYLPVLGECVVADRFSQGTIQDEVRAYAVEAITRYFSDEAAEVLLEVVKRPITDAVRTQCFDALEKIRRYQDERAKFASRRVEAHARAEAIAKLVAMLGDPDAEVRALCARSLATLGAVELLPELIGLLRDDDAAVREAARAAIAHLTAESDG